MTIRNLDALLRAEIGGPDRGQHEAGQRRPHHRAQPAGGRLFGAGVARQSQARRDRGQRLLCLARRPAGRARPRRHRHAARDRAAASIAELGAKGTRAAVVITAGVRGELKQAMLDAARPHTAAHPGPQLPRPDAAGHRPQRQLLRTARRCAGDLAFVSQSGALITAIVDWARGARHRLLARRLARRHGRRRLRRPARLPGRRRQEPRDPALHGIGDAARQVHVGGAARGAHQAGASSSRPGRGAAGRQGRAVAYRRAGRRGRGLRGGVPARRPAARARARRSVQRRRDAGARIRRLQRRAAGHPHQRRRRRRAGGRPAERPAAAASPRCPTPRRPRSTPCCRRPGRTAIRSTSSATPTRRATPRALRRAAGEDEVGRRAGHELPDGARLEHRSCARRWSASLQQRARPAGRQAAARRAGSATRRAARRAGCSRAKGIAELRHAGRGHRRLHAARAATRARRRS